MAAFGRRVLGEASAAEHADSRWCSSRRRRRAGRRHRRRGCLVRVGLGGARVACDGQWSSRPILSSRRCDKKEWRARGDTPLKMGAAPTPRGARPKMSVVLPREGQGTRAPTCCRRLPQLQPNPRRPDKSPASSGLGRGPRYRRQSVARVGDDAESSARRARSLLRACY